MRRRLEVPLSIVVLLALTVLTAAECPNGCSGNGACMSKDMCECYKNYQGNDCADRTCLFGYAHVDTPKGDINMDQDRKSADWLLANSQQAPAQTYEYFNPGAKQHEAHFYMECSNKGVCDRETGACACFDGFEGSACHRTTCPSKCSGHGTCESIRELGAKAIGTLFGIEQPTGAVEYDLWDANSTYGCNCDPWYRGPDCNKRTCKVGVDPLYLASGTARYETFVIHAWTTGTFPGSAWVRLRVFDYYGESYITRKIPILEDSTAGTEVANKAANAAAVENALKAVPNLTFRDVTCETIGVASTGYEDFLSVRHATAGKGMSVICQYTDNPGKHRIPEVESFVLDTSANSFVKIVTTGVQGEDEDWFTKKSTLTATAIGATPFVALAVGLGGSTLAANLPASGTPTLMKIGDDVVVATSWTDPTTITLAYSFKKTFATNAPIFLQGSYAAPTGITLTVVKPISAVVAVGDARLTFGGDPRVNAGAITANPAATPPVVAVPATTAIATGDKIFFHNQFFFVQQIYEDSTTAGTFYAELDKPFGGSSKDGGSAVVGDLAYRIVLPEDKSLIYSYVSECSGRGLCSSETGVCACFKGYTNDNCNTQNILAL